MNVTLGNKLVIVEELGPANKKCIIYMILERLAERALVWSQTKREGASASHGVYLWTGLVLRFALRLIFVI